MLCSTVPVHHVAEPCMKFPQCVLANKIFRFGPVFLAWRSLHNCKPTNLCLDSTAGYHVHCRYIWKWGND